MSTSVSLYTDDKELSAFLSKIDKLNKFIIDQNEKPWLNLNHNGTWVALPSGTLVPFGPPIVSMFCFDLMCKCYMFFFGCNKKAMLKRLCMYLLRDVLCAGLYDVIYIHRVSEKTAQTVCVRTSTNFNQF